MEIDVDDLKSCPFCGAKPETAVDTYARCKDHTPWLTLKDWEKRIAIAAPQIGLDSETLGNSGSSTDRSAGPAAISIHRAVLEKWQESTGRHDTWPDHADLCVFLMGEIDTLENPDKTRPFFKPEVVGWYIEAGGAKFLAEDTKGLQVGDIAYQLIKKKDYLELLATTKEKVRNVISKTGA